MESFNPISHPDYFNSLVEGFKASSARSRQQIVITALSSVLAFIACYDSHHDSWLTSRHLNVAISQYFSTSKCIHKDIIHGVYHSFDIYQADIERFEEKKKKLGFFKRIASPEAKLYETIIDSLENARVRMVKENAYRIIQNEPIRFTKNKINYITGTLFYMSARGRAFTEEHMIENVEGSAENQSTRVNTIGIPVLGVAFDINDLTFLSGMFFSVLLSLICFSSWREIQNIEMVLDATSGRVAHKKTMYEMLSMNQILTVPPDINAEENLIRKFQKQFPKFLHIAPFLVLMYCFHYDWETMDIGRQIDPEKTTTSMWLGGGFTILVSLLTYAAVRYTVVLDYFWRMMKKDFTSEILYPNIESLSLHLKNILPLEIFKHEKYYAEVLELLNKLVSKYRVQSKFFQPNKIEYLPTIVKLEKLFNDISFEPLESMEEAKRQKLFDSLKGIGINSPEERFKEFQMGVYEAKKKSISAILGLLMNRFKKG